MALITEACDFGFHGRCFKDWCDCDCRPRKGASGSWWVRVLHRRVLRRFAGSGR